jgi:hypothetical protein
VTAYFFHRISQITPLRRRWWGGVSTLWLATWALGCDAPPETTPASDDGPGPVTSAPPHTDAPVATAVAASASPTEIDRLRAGDLPAMKRLELLPLSARSPEQLLALADGRAELARRDALRLVDDLRGEERLRRDPATLAYAAKLALDQAAAPTLFSGLIAIGDPGLHDFVHDLGARGDPSARLPLLVHDLLRVKAHRAKASKALTVLLELEDAELCWQVANQLVPAAADADSRASAMLDHFTVEKGCGPKKLDDCWPCLREATNAESLQKAIDGAATRKFDAFWLAK